MTWPIVAGAAGVGVFGLSYVVEALRHQRAAPTHASWAPALQFQYIDVDGLRLRYVVTGSGEPVVLLHTLRTQLDMFQRVIPALATHHTVYAMDFPGHGYSDIPDTEYTPELFVRATAGFLDRIAIHNAIVAGESIGGTVALILAAERHPRVTGVVAVNPYDYAGGRGIRRSSQLANLLFGVSDVPLLGGTVMRLRSYLVIAHVLEGGVHDKRVLPRELVREMNRVGNRRGHYRALMSLVHHWGEWEEARARYASIASHVELVYGQYDWSLDAEREADARDIPRAHLTVIPNAGHFLSLEAPQAFIEAVDRATSPVRSR